MASLRGDGREGREKREGGIRQTQKGVFARERSDRGNLSGAKILFFAVVLVLQVLQIFQVPPTAFAWGSITHSAICRDAGGNTAFVMAGIAPDMIALRSVTTGDASYDYAHNCYGDAQEPVFGNTLSDLLASDFSLGWRAHQLADSVVHGPGGYSTSKILFRNLPGQYGNDINHGAVELVVDAIVLDEYYWGNVSLNIPQQPELIHEAAITFYNRNIAKDRAIPRTHIISCREAENMAFFWENCLQTNIYLASMLSNEDWFSETRKDFSDYRRPYERSLAKLSGLSTRVNAPTGIMQRFVDILAPPRLATAAETAPIEEGKSGYLLFLSKVSARARVIGGGKATTESTRQAIKELSTLTSVSAEDRAWAAAIFEMTNGKNKNVAELERSVSGRILRGRDGSKKGAAGGQKTSLLPYLPCSMTLFLITAVLIWHLNRRRR